MGKAIGGAEFAGGPVGVFPEADELGGAGFFDELGLTGGGVGDAAGGVVGIEVQLRVWRLREKYRSVSVA